MFIDFNWNSSEGWRSDVSSAFSKELQLSGSPVLHCKVLVGGHLCGHPLYKYIFLSVTSYIEQLAVSTNLCCLDLLSLLEQHCGVRLHLHRLTAPMALGVLGGSSAGSLPCLLLQ